jgi:hypothetical protein
MSGVGSDRLKEKEGERSARDQMRRKWKSRKRKGTAQKAFEEAQNHKTAKVAKERSNLANHERIVRVRRVRRYEKHCDLRAWWRGEIANELGSSDGTLSIGKPAVWESFSSKVS